jgi:hypothetical protein
MTNGCNNENSNVMSPARLKVLLLMAIMIVMAMCENNEIEKTVCNSNVCRNINWHCIGIIIIMIMSCIINE